MSTQHIAASQHQQSSASHAAQFQGVSAIFQTMLHSSNQDLNPHLSGMLSTMAGCITAGTKPAAPAAGLAGEVAVPPALPPTGTQAALPAPPNEESNEGAE
jgi:hypothetical protein